jgi:hypothetical protein
MYLKKDKYLKILFIVIFFGWTFILYKNTAFGKVDLKELFKIFFPVFTLWLLSNLDNSKKIFCFKALYFILGIHIIIAFIYQLCIEGYFLQLTNDRRYFLPLLGRGPGDIAIAFFVLFVSTVFYLKVCPLSKNIKDRILLSSIFLSLLFSILAQSRTWILISFMFILITYKSLGYRKLIFNQAKLSMFFLMILMVTVLHTNFLYEIYKRTNYSLLSGRAEIWLLSLESLTNHSRVIIYKPINFNKNPNTIEIEDNVSKPINDNSHSELLLGKNLNSHSELLLGKNLERKLLIDASSGIETSDSHSFYFDLAQTYGLLGIFYLIFSYLLLIRNTLSINSIALVVCFFIVGFVMSPFKIPYLFYINVLLLLIPMISWPTTDKLKSTN